MQVSLKPDLTLTIGGAVARLTPGGAFRWAEKLIGGAMRQMIEEECSATEGAGSLPAGHEAPMIELVTLVGWNAGAWKCRLRGQSIRDLQPIFFDASLHSPEGQLQINGEARLMSGSIGARLARLEKGKGIGWMYTISASDEVLSRDDFDPDVWLRSRGHDVSARDLVVMLRYLSSSAAAEPVLVSAQPMG